MLNRQQTITWNNAEPLHWRIYVVLGVDGLMLSFVANHSSTCLSQISCSYINVSKVSPLWYTSTTFKVSLYTPGNGKPQKWADFSKLVHTIVKHSQLHHRWSGMTWLFLGNPFQTISFASLPDGSAIQVCRRCDKIHKARTYDIIHFVWIPVTAS